MKFRFFCVFLFGLVAFNALAAINITGVFNGSEPTNSARMNRNGVASTCAAAKSYPGTLASVPIRFSSYTTYNNGPSRCVSVSYVCSVSNGTDVFFSAYSAPVNLADLSAGYLADAGSGGQNGSFSFVAPANSPVYLSVNSVGTASPTCNFTLTSAELDLSLGSLQAIPTLQEWGGLALVGMMLAGVVWIRRRRI